MSVRFAVAHGCSSTSREDWWPPRYVPDVSSSLLLVLAPSTAESRFPSHRTSYIYGISRNLCFDGRQSSDCCRPPCSRFDVEPFIYRNIWLCSCDVAGNLLRKNIIRSCGSPRLAILMNLLQSSTKYIVVSYMRILKKFFCLINYECYLMTSTYHLLIIRKIQLLVCSVRITSGVYYVFVYEHRPPLKMDSTPLGNRLKGFF